jgi:hypothetical protein
MPGLVGGARVGNVEAYFYDLVVGTEHSLRYSDNPGVGSEVYETTHVFGVDLDVVALGTASYGSAGALEGFFIQAHYVVVHGLHPIALESAFEGDYTVAVETTHYFRDVVLIGPG